MSSKVHSILKAVQKLAKEQKASMRRVFDIHNKVQTPAADDAQLLKREEHIVHTALSSVKNPITGANITESLSKIVIEGDAVFLTIYGNAKDALLLDPVRLECETRLKELGIFNKVAVSLASAPAVNQKKLPGVQKIIVVASGKGGVGKSTIALHLALTLMSMGHKVGLVDADIYGPSLPTLTGILEKPQIEKNLMIPHLWSNILLMSLGFLVAPGSAAVWRGPMTTKVLYQLIRMTKWGNLDFLIVDTPPGTGDVHLSLAENYQLDGAIIVSTPQELSAADARKGIDMYNKLSVPILGIIENMSFFTAPDGTIHYIFGTREVCENLAREISVPLLAKLPIDNAIAAAKPIENDNILKLFRQIAGFVCSL